MFEGGFLGLDNIGVFDRSSPLPTGGYLEQADGTAWMVFFSQQMLRIAVELALHYPVFEEFVIKFFEHTMWIAGAMDRMGEASGQDVGRRGWLLLRRAAYAQWRGFSFEGAIDGGPAAAGGSRDLRGRHARKVADSTETHPGVYESVTRTSRRTFTCRARRVWRADACSPP